MNHLGALLASRCHPKGIWRRGEEFCVSEEPLGDANVASRWNRFWVPRIGHTASFTPKTTQNGRHRMQDKNEEETRPRASWVLSPTPVPQKSFIGKKKNWYLSLGLWNFELKPKASELGNAGLNATKGSTLKTMHKTIVLFFFCSGCCS